MYQTRSTSAVKQDLGELDSSARRAILEEHLPSIQSDPRAGEPLHYAFRGLRSYHFSHRGASYRIIYEIDPEQEVVILLVIGPRSRLYQRLHRRLRA